MLNSPTEIDSRGRIAGSSTDADRRSKAYVWSRERGLVDIHPDGAVESIVEGMTSNGVIGGWLAMTKVGQSDGIFLYTRGQGTRIVAGTAKLSRFASKSGLNGFRSVGVRTVNRRLEFVGGVVGAGGGRRFFLLDGNGKFHDLQDLVDDAGAQFTVRDVLDLNDQGRILVEGVASGRSTAAVLTPVG